MANLPEQQQSGALPMTTLDTTLPADPMRNTALQYEDALGKLVLVGFFLWLLSNSLGAVTALVLRPGHDLMWALTLISHTASVGFVGLIVWLTVTRKAPIDVATGVEARVSAFFGTFILLSLIAVPRAEVGETQAFVATLLIIVGTLSSILCLWWLGRAFAVAAAARELVTSGPYAYVRHPLYTAEAITVAGVILFNGSLAAVLVGVVQVFFQYRRIVNEEKVLGRAFGSYAAYKASTPMILPRLF